LILALNHHLLIILSLLQGIMKDRLNGDVIVNVLTTEMRQRYNIEKVWGDCEFLELDLED